MITHQHKYTHIPLWKEILEILFGTLWTYWLFEHWSKIQAKMLCPLKFNGPIRLCMSTVHVNVRTNKHLNLRKQRKNVILMFSYCFFSISFISVFNRSVFGGRPGTTWRSCRDRVRGPPRLRLWRRVGPDRGKSRLQAARLLWSNRSRHREVPDHGQLRNMSVDGCWMHWRRRVAVNVFS